MRQEGYEGGSRKSGDKGEDGADKPLVLGAVVKAKEKKLGLGERRKDKAKRKAAQRAAEEKALYGEGERASVPDMRVSPNPQEIVDSVSANPADPEEIAGAVPGTAEKEAQIEGTPVVKASLDSEEIMGSVRAKLGETEDVRNAVSLENQSYEREREEVNLERAVKKIEAQLSRLPADQLGELREDLDNLKALREAAESNRALTIHVRGKKQPLTKTGVRSKLARLETSLLRNLPSVESELEGAGIRSPKVEGGQGKVSRIDTATAEVAGNSGERSGTPDATPQDTPVAVEAPVEKPAPIKRAKREEPPAWDGDIPTTETNTPSEDEPMNIPEKTPRKQPLKERSAIPAVSDPTLRRHRYESARNPLLRRTEEVSGKVTETEVAPDLAPAEAAAVEVPEKSDTWESAGGADILKTWGIMPEPTAASNVASETKAAPDSAPIEAKAAPRVTKSPEGRGGPILTVEEWVKKYSATPNPYEARIAEMMQYGSKDREDAIATINDVETKISTKAALAEAEEKNRLALEGQIREFAKMGANRDQALEMIGATKVYTEGGDVEAAAQILESGTAPAEAIPPQPEPEMTPEQKELLVQRLGAAGERAEIITSSAPAKHREWVKKNLSSLDAQVNKAADWYNGQNWKTKVAVGGLLMTGGLVGVAAGGWVGGTVGVLSYGASRGVGYLGTLATIDAVQQRLGSKNRKNWKGGLVKHGGALAFALFMPSLVQYADSQLGATKFLREYLPDWLGGEKGGKSTTSDIKPMTSDNFDVPKDAVPVNPLLMGDEDLQVKPMASDNFDVPRDEVRGSKGVEPMTSDNFDVPKDAVPVNPLLMGDERASLEGALSEQRFSDPEVVKIPLADANDLPLSDEPPPVSEAEFGPRSPDVMDISIPLSEEPPPVTAAEFGSREVQPMTSDNFDVGVDRNPGGTVFTEPAAELVRYFNEPVKVKPGDNVWNIIQHKLGPNGSQADVLARVEFLKSLSQWQQDSMGLGKWDSRIQGWNIMPGTVLHLDVLDVMPQPKGGGVAATVIEQSRAIPPTESPAPVETVKNTGPTLVATEARVRAEMYQRFKSNGIFGIGKTDGSMLYNVVREVPVGEFMPLAQPDHRGFSQLQKLDGAHYTEMRKYVTEQMAAMKRAGVTTAGFEKLKLEEFARKVAEFRITLPR